MYFIKNVELMRFRLSFKFPSMMFDSITEMFLWCVVGSWSMEAVLSRLRGLSADELREEFTRADVKCGPITATTRATFERKLARVLAGPENSTPGTENCSTAGILGSATEGADHAKPGSAVAATRSSPAAAGSDDVDFGYGMGLNPPEEDEVSVKTSSNSTAEVSNSQYKTETPFKTPAQVSPTFYYGVCPPWDDVLAKTGKTHWLISVLSDKLMW